MMFKPKHSGWLFAFIMSGFMAFCMSGILTLINLGLVDNFIWLWLRAYVLAHLCAFPLVMLFAPFSRRIVEWLVK
ncbi:hypothetical protein GCM10011357_00280 [Lacimicrobium alkaliphilum]|uniref:DUF2798 domain-containing protein n=3 Tax=Lacimicrobium alkaliphilum TaxID=1526571 RepID=A0ABQ1QYB5_9ALTE|nr:hypothetical protein GCM10011357_00280 [Lacimicrobium alkaliphilum]